MSRRKQLNERARRALLWGTALFFGTQLGLALLVETRTELRDPKFGYRMMHLRERLAEHPDRPLVVVLGSSRVEAGFRPALLPEVALAEPPAKVNTSLVKTASHTSTAGRQHSDPSESQPAMVFNFGLPFQGVPAVTLLGVERLLAETTPPRHLFVEILVPALNQPQPIDELIKAEQYEWNELAVFRPFARRPTRMYRRWIASRITPGYGHRLCLVSRFGHELLPHETRQDLCYYEADGLGWRSGEWKMSDEERRQRAERSKNVYYEAVHNFQVTAEPDQALRKVVELCRTAGVGLTFFTMPEARFFREWYTPESERQVAAYFERLSRECEVEIIDARAWIDDELHYTDGHHLMDAGAEAFTRRFEREVLRPALEETSRNQQDLATRLP